MLLLAILVEGRTIMQSGAEDDRINSDDPVPEKSRPGFSFVNPPRLVLVHAALFGHFHSEHVQRFSSVTKSGMTASSGHLQGLCYKTIRDTELLER
jgi:hypothetical protein